MQVKIKLVYNPVNRFKKKGNLTRTKKDLDKVLSANSKQTKYKGLYIKSKIKLCRKFIGRVGQSICHCCDSSKY